MLVHKGGKIKNWGGECRDVTPTKYQGRCEKRSEFFVKIKKFFFFFFFFWGGGGGSGRGGGMFWRGGGHRVDVNKEFKFLKN